MAKTQFNDGNKQLGIQGTQVLAAFLNSIFAHRHDGLDNDGSAPSNYAVDTGAANAYAIALTPALTAHITGLPIFFKAVNANTGASTINVNGLGAVAIKMPDGADLTAGVITAGQIASVIYTGAYYQLLSKTSDGALPVGSVIHVAQGTAPAGYLKANGSLISRSTYAALFAAIGTTFGAGDGATTFTLPDLRGEFIRGYDDSRGADSGRVFGTAQTDLTKQHTHSLDLGGGNNYNANHEHEHLGYTGIASMAPSPPSISENLTQTIDVGSTIGSETRPRNIALLACIKY